jgi:hypothetical protein
MTALQPDGETGRRMKSPIEIIQELSRRRVIRSVGGYIGIVWVLSLGAAEFFPAFGLPSWSVRAFVLAGIAAIPIVALLSWKFDLSRHGLIRDLPPPVAGAAPSTESLVSDLKTTVTRHEGGYVTVAWTLPNGTLARREFSDRFIVGRDLQADVRLDDSRVSRRHLAVFFEGGRWRVRDLRSSNGTYLDGRRITETDLPTRCRLRLDRHGPELSIELCQFGATTTLSRAH